MTDAGASSGSSAVRPPSQALAEVLVDELVRGGVREAVLCPGSRNAPLSYALHAADAAGRLRLHVRIDERTAGFLALGLSKATGKPVPVCCTSGTAVANLHPAMVEAGESGVGVIALTSDRPAHLRGTGANQTIDQVGIFGTAAVLTHDLPAPATTTATDNAAWRSLVCRVLDAGQGPVHLNVQLADPLIPVAASITLPPELAGRPDDSPWTYSVRAYPGWAMPELPPHRYYAPPDDPLRRTLVVLGDARGEDLARFASWAGRAGYPVIAEPSSWGAAGVGLLATGSALLSSAELVATVLPMRVVVAGRPTLGRALGALVRRPDVQLSILASGGRRSDWTDPDHRAVSVVERVDELGSAPVDPRWAAAWTRADTAAAVARDAALASGIEGPALARLVRDGAVSGVGEGVGMLVVAASQAVRDLELAGPPRDSAALQVLANRGAAGIDGTLSTAVGAALAHQAAGGRRAFALVGDLAFVHDLNGLVIGPGEPRPDLTIVVADDDGGAIFSTLEYGLPEHAAAFERIFGTPIGVDIPVLCAGVGVPCVTAADRPGIEAALADPQPGLRVVHVRTDRTGRREGDAALRAAVHAAVAHAVGDGTRPGGD